MELTIYALQYITAVGLIETTPEITLLLSIIPICLQSFEKFVESWKQIGINQPLYPICYKVNQNRFVFH